MKYFKVRMWVNVDGNDIYSSTYVTASTKAEALNMAINKQYSKSIAYFSMVDFEVTEC